MIWLGKVLKDYQPTQTLDTGQSKSFVEMLPLQDYNAMSRIDSLSKTLIITLRYWWRN
jgi:hypothetical protein